MTFNIWTFLFEIVNFVVLAYVLHRLLYRPLRAAIDQRREAIAHTQDEAESARAAATALQLQLQSQLSEIEQERQDAIQQTRELAETERQKLIADGEKTIVRRQEEARLAIDLQRDEALRSLRSELNAAAAELAARLLTEATGGTLQQQLVKRLVETLSHVPANQREKLRVDWSEADGALVETATTLDAILIQQISQAVNALVGQPVNLAMQTKPKLLAGARVRIGGHVWDASLASQFEGLSSAGSEGTAHA
ncbi:MAG: F0F1 ATP synthase subunit delta [Pirellulales bacterium]|nr:F0F1 ATP synthase subunit delta [Pirellulales bacterium]